MRVAALKGKTSRCWIEVPSEEEGGESERIWVDYRAGELTLGVGDEIRAAVDGGFVSDVGKVVLKRILVDWDLQDDNGDPLGVGDEAINSVPLPFIGQVLQAIQDDILPNAPTGATSDDGSPQMAPLVAVPTGTSSSEHRTGSLVSPGSS